MRTSFLILMLVLAACGPRSPHVVASQASGLDIPSNAQVIAFEDETAGFLSQDLHLRIELALTPVQVAKLAAEARREGYASVPTEVSPSDTANEFGFTATGVAEARAELDGDSVGLFRYERDTPSSLALVVLDTTRRRLVIHLQIL